MRMVSYPLRETDELQTLHLSYGSRIVSVTEREMIPVLNILVPVNDQDTEEYKIQVVSNRYTEEGYPLQGYECVGSISLRRDWNTHFVFVRKVHGNI